MLQKPLGDSNLLVTQLGLGLAALGRPGYINLGHATDLQGRYETTAMADHAATVLDTAWQGGIRYFDVARSYGRSEEFLGRWLRKRSIVPDTVVVGSKWGYRYTADWQVKAEHHEIKEHTLATLTEQWPQSLAQLGPYLRLYQIHSATLESGVLQDRAVLAALAARKEDGGCVGLSLSGAQQSAVLEQAMTCRIDGVRLFDAVQATWNLLEPSAAPALAVAQRAGIGVIVKEVLANGRLTTRNLDPTFAPKLALLQQQSQRLGGTVDALAIAAALAQLHWDDEAADALAGLAESPGQYWNTRSRLVWN